MKRSHGRSEESIEFAKSQRQTSNEFASNVWQWIRNRQCYNQKFRREFPIPPYTVDFCCIELQLIIEIDGEHHLTIEGIEHDRIRDQYLRRLGYQILRIPGYDVIRDNGDVRERIREFVQAAIHAVDPSPPSPLPEAGRGEQEKN
jgi:very-short-patch-repair endonuclease